MIYSNLSDFYRSKAWRDFRKQLINERRNKEDGLLYCEYSGEVIVSEWQAVAHHIKPLTAANVNDVSIAFNPDNIQIVSHQSHNQIHKRFGYSSSDRKVYLVVGAPLAGKTTFVKNAKGNSDLVIDFDELVNAMTLSTTGAVGLPKALNAVLFTARQTLLEQVKMRQGKCEQCWIVSAEGLRSQVEDMADMLGAEIIEVDTSKEICLQRAENFIDKNYSSNLKRFIEEYFEKKGI